MTTVVSLSQSQVATTQHWLTVFGTGSSQDRSRVIVSHNDTAGTAFTGRWWTGKTLDDIVVMAVTMCAV